MGPRHYRVGCVKYVRGSNFLTTVSGLRKDRSTVVAPLRLRGVTIVCGRSHNVNLVILVIILLLLFGGGGFYFGGPYVGGGLGTILLIVLIVLLVRG